MENGDQTLEMWSAKAVSHCTPPGTQTFPVRCVGKQVLLVGILDIDEVMKSRMVNNQSTPVLLMHYKPFSQSVKSERLVTGCCGGRFPKSDV